MALLAPPEGRPLAGDPASQPLALVGDELAVTLNEARGALEQYVEGEAGNAPLERCAGLLHSVRGVLQITETYGASLLAEEMEQACLVLLKGRRDAQPAEAIEALTRAAVQLPAYVDRVRHGGRDVPLVLLPLLNDLRAVRGRPLLSESTLLLLNLGPAAGGPAAAPARTPTGENIATVAKSLRPRFQLALLGWIRGDDATTSLGQLRAVAARLEAAARLDVVHQLWWVVGGVLEALVDGGLEAGVSVKRLIGQADRELKRLQTLGEKRFAEKPPVELTNNLLYYVARATSRGPRVGAIRAAFNLSGLIPGDEQVERVRESLGAPSVRLMQTVAGAIREDLARVKDVLDIYVRTGMERVEELVPQVEMLKKIGDTLGVLGLGRLRESIEGQRAALAELTAADVPVEEAALVGMAAMLLEVEDRLEPELLALIDAGGDAITAPADGAAADGSDVASLTPAVMRECLANLARVKEAISLVTERGGEPAALDGIPGLLRGITAALLMLERERAARLAESLAAAVRDAVGGSGSGAGPVRLERLADAIVSLEYYMETLQAGRREPAYMLDNAERCLTALTGPAAVPDLPTLASDAATEVSIPPTVVIATPDPTRTRPSADRPVVTPRTDGIDPEILELFIEEAREAIDTILARFPAWELDEGDRDALLTIRRAYHTLKGSGRMVGAELIGDYAWSIESLLNRVIDGAVARTPELMDFMRRAGHGMAELLEQLEVGTPPAIDIPALMAAAEALARRAPEPTPAPDDLAEDTELLPALEIAAALGPVDGPLVPAEAAPESTVAARAPEATPTDASPTTIGVPADAPPGPGGAAAASGIDPVLLDILAREVTAHVGALREYLARAAEPGAGAVPEAVFRACHTLHGSLTMAGVAAGVAVAEPLHELVAALHNSHQVPSADAIAAAADGAQAIEAVVARLAEPDLPLPDTAPVAARLVALAAAAAAEAAGPAAADGKLSVRIPALTTGEESPVAAEAAPGAMTMAVAFDAEIASLFAEEAAELLEVSDQALTQLVAGTDVTQSLDELKRALHTLKGGARMARLFAIGDLSHELETLLIRMADGLVPRQPATLALVRQAFDELHRLRDQIAGGDIGVAPAALLASLASALAEPAADAAAVVAAPAAPEAEPAALPVDAGIAVADGLATADDVAQEPGPIDALPAAPDGSMTAADAEGSANVAADTDTDTEAEPFLAAAITALQPVLPEAPPADTPEPDLEVVATGMFGPDFLAIGDRLVAGAEAYASAMAEDVASPGEAAELPAEADDATLAGVPPVPDLPADAATLPEDATAVLPAPGPAGAPADGSAPVDGLAAAAAVVAGDGGPATDDTAPVPTLEPLAPTLEKLGELARALAAPPLPAVAQPGEARAADARLAEARAREAREVARVDAQLLEQLLNGAGEISIGNSRLNQQLTLITFHLEELGQTVLRLRDQLRKLEIETEAQILFRHQADGGDRAGFDPLELDRYSTIQQLSRSLAESASDVSSLKDLLQNLSGDAEALLIQQARTTTELQDGLMRTRMVPFQQHGARLTRLVRQTARETGKLAELVIDGGGELDRQVLEKMLPPFEHMLRNAVVHGIEPPAEREAAGKPATGTIRIAVRREGAEVVIDVADDGRGLDVAAIRRKALELGFVTPDLAISDEQAMQFILRTGFSTADRLTQAAGRGIGMDVVASQVARLGGTLAIASRAGQGTTFTLRLPFTLAVTQALIVRVGVETYALPLPTVGGIIRIPRSEYDARLRQPEPSIDYGGRRYPFRHLGQFVGLPASRIPEELDRVSVILVRGGEHAAAIVTDEMQDSREIVVKPVGPQLATVRGISGATILGDGRIVMILDVAALVRANRAAAPVAVAPRATPALPVALVVDDSITMRRVTQRLLERNGFRVVTAKDGLDAISVLADHRPDIILLDVEMPRMDGYEFARHVRNQPDLASVPIVMVTSRVSDKHRARAIEIGVNDYLGKPYQERELLVAVNAQLGR